MNTICIVDYGVGNIHSAMKGLRLFTSDVILSEDPAEIAAASALVLPGQGAFEAGMEGLRVRGLIDVVKKAAKDGKPILGICLGAQLLLEKGFEFGKWDGLGFMPGTVEHFPTLTDAKTPHMGWNSIEETASGRWKETPLKDVKSGADMYFIHSYILRPSNADHILAKTIHGGITFASTIGRDNILGCQFHPEKSGQAGLSILKNFVAQANNS